HMKLQGAGLKNCVTELYKQKTCAYYVFGTVKDKFVLASIGYAVGLGNVWRFPYLCYRSGGGAFLIPYLIMLFLCGIPLLFMEFTVGQYTRLGPVHALAKICPLFKGVGLATVVISYVLCTYYNVLMTWALYYLLHSFSPSLPWQSCNNTWNAVGNCSTGFPGNATHLQSASQQFFDHKVLEVTTGIEHAGGIRWELFGLLVLAWAIVYLCIFKGVKSTGKVVYFTATFPYFILFALLINNVQLPGAKDGILFFLMPNWSKLLEVQVWVNAAAQIFNSIGISFGSMISMASYNKFNNNILRDTFIVCLANSATSIVAGFVIFSAIGYMAHIHNLPVDDIATDGPGLVFVVYPEVFSTMPFSQLWAPLFFIMLLCLGLDSQKLRSETQIIMVEKMLGKKPNLFFRVCWQFLSPMLVLGILISSIFQYTPARYGKSYTYPFWAEVVGWFISLVSIIWIPLGALHELWTTEGSMLQRLKKSITPTVDLESVSEKPSTESIVLFTAA
uniref:Transporter n=1 Tax=Cyprinus carpio TaxID=7962 RepID=A0A8C2A290_CYPCA